MLDYKQYVHEYTPEEARNLMFRPVKSEILLFNMPLNCGIGWYLLGALCQDFHGVCVIDFPSNYRKWLTFKSSPY